MTEEEKEKEAQFSYLFPLLRYHDRWSQLTNEDFQYWFTRDQVSDNGYLMQTGIKPYETPYVERPLVDYTLGENSWYWLNKMVELCREHGTQLVLIKAPSMSPFGGSSGISKWKTMLPSRVFSISICWTTLKISASTGPQTPMTQACT